ncbi:MAG: DUF1326 domain-containing protein [Acidobacteriota bacterium]
MAAPAWEISGQYMESCNCDYLCPCIFTNPQGQVTHDHCIAVLVFRIDEGHSGVTKLAGLSFAMVIRSGKVMADGNWIYAGIVDERASPTQRQALAAIVGGEAGGPPGMIRSALVKDFRGIEYRRLDIALDGMNRKAASPGVFEFEIDAVLSRNKSGDALYIDNSAHPAGRRLALARAKEFHLHGFGLDLDIAGIGNNGHFAPFSWAA